MSKINAVCVYCGSSPGTDPAFVKAARDFGKILAESGVRLVYGGGSIGLMGAVASAVIEHGGAATGIIPEFLTAKERPRRLAQEQIVTRDMHERKRTMFDRADAFVALPGGLGTLEELIEQMTWAQLGRHKKPILIANINGFWDPLLLLIDHMRGLGLVPSPARGVELLVADNIRDILPKLRAAAGAVTEAEKTMAIPAERL
ncbi:MAG: TIGR00730 family Rossman fold protein [Xanthobacteraceae bacterium]